MSFVHLHLHSEYSLLDGFANFDRLFDCIKAYEMPAVALTDHGNMFGAIEFYSKAKKAGIKPILGCEVYFTSGSRHDRIRDKNNPTRHQLLLARNRQGYINLCKLVSLGYFEGFYYKPRIDEEVLRLYSDGLIGTSSCLAGEIPQLLLAGEEERAEERAREYQDIFGKDHYFIELQDHNLDAQHRINPMLMRLAKKISAKVIATNDCHYVSREDAPVHDTLLCIQMGKTVEDPTRMRFDSDQFYVKSPQEMKELFSEVPEAISNTLAVAEQSEVSFDFDNYLFPNFELPAGVTLDDHLEHLALQGLSVRMPLISAANQGQMTAEMVQKTYHERLQYELGVIRKMGFSGYFLIVGDFIAYAKKSGIPVGPGRGSAAGSLVAYALQITDVDPIPYKLLFERFLNPGRISMPDIDIDFCVHGRDQVIKYVTNKYGKDDGGILEARVAQIITFGRMKARAVIRDVGRALNMPYGDVDRIAKLVPPAINITLEEAFEQEPKFEELRSEGRQNEELLTNAKALEGFVRHASIHAAGVVISDDRPLVEHMPLFRGVDGEVATQYDMKMVEKLGLIKFDFLGLKTLTVIHHCLDLIKQTTGEVIDLESLPLEDEKVYRFLTRGETTGIFQLESSGMRDLIRRLKPESFGEIIALVALYRPGPLGSGMVDDFIKRKHGTIPIEYELPQLEEILKETYGVILYQEQVMEIAVRLANYSLGDADMLRKAMGKKIAEVMQEQKAKFMAGSLANNIPQDRASRIFDLMEKFGGYGFNKSHSTAYALVSFQTAYFKTHYPVQFMAALLKEDIGNTDKVISYINDCRTMDIVVAPPSINHSQYYFDVVHFAKDKKELRFGLGAVKGIGEGAIEALKEAREADGDFKDLFEFCRRADLNRINRKVVEALIKCGAVDSFGVERSRNFAVLDKAVESGVAHQKQVASGQFGLFAQEMQETPKHVYPPLDEWDEKVRLNFERESAGFYITGHPLTKYSELLGRFCTTTTESIHELKDRDKVLMGGVVMTSKEITTKKGDRMAFTTIEDLHGSIEGIVFPKVYAVCMDLLRGDEPICVRGYVDRGDDQNKLIVDEVTLLDDAEASMASQVHIRLTKPSLSQETLRKIKSVMLQYPGEIETRLHIRLDDGRDVALALPKEQWVRPSIKLRQALIEAAAGTTDVLIDVSVIHTEPKPRFQKPQSGSQS